ncbi:hypothetical protein [Microbispora sp. ATCC PTA-5024]|uniref:hypothetical protein n=1 Tax=Microbispora sp. ATCC PTA-5024 TaxID=316330 RepID=UPI000416C799|nr:hypothetical protein [Microbispora sp. ATCC PTA-5024]
MAERSVSAKLTLKVSGFLAGANDAQRALGDLNRKFVETAGFASGFRAKLDNAFKRLPKIELDANSTPAEVKIAELRKQLETLRDKKVGVDIDAGAALAEMHMIQRELSAIDDRDISFDVRAGVAGAMAELAAVDAEISRLDGQTANVNVSADVMAALTAIASVRAALAALVAAPALISIGAIGASLGGAFAAAGAGAVGFAGVAIPALGRVNDALKQQQTAAGGAGGATQSLAQKQAQAAASALQLAQAQERVRRANEAVKDASRGVVQAQQDVKRAQDAVAQAASEGAARVADAVRRVSDAERQYADAVRASKDAQEALNDARREAARDLEDLGNRLADTQLDQRQAALDLADAKKQLDAVQGNRNSSAADIERATIAYERAQQRVKELGTEVQRLQQDKSEADAKGVEGSDRVKSAQDALAAANQQVADSQQAIADAQRGVAEAQTQAARDVAQAQDRVAQAQERLLDAQRKYSDAQRDAIMAERQLKVERLQQKAALDKAGGAAGGAASKMADLSKREKDLAKDIKSFQDSYKKWQQSLEGDVFPVISKGMAIVKSHFKDFTPLVKTAAGSFSTLEDEAKKALEGPWWDTFLKDLNHEMPDAIEGLGHIAGNVFKGMTGVIDAILPHANDAIGAFEKGSEKFADWGQKLKNDPGFNGFMDTVKANAPKVAEIIGNIATAVGKIVQAGGNIGPGVLDLLVGISEHLAKLSPDQVQAVATGVGLIFGALKLGQGLKLTVLLALADVLIKLPPPVLYSIAGGITAIIVAVKLQQTVKGVTEWWSGLGLGIKKAGDAAEKAKPGLAGAGGAAEKAAGGFSGLSGTLKGGAIALGIGAIAGAATGLRDKLSGLNPDIHTLAQNIAAVADGGKPAPELLNQINGKVSALDPSQWENFGDVASRLTSDNTFAKLGGQINGVFSDTFGVNLDSGLTRIQNLDKGLATAVQSGNGAQAAKMFDILAKMAADSGVSVDKLKTLFPEYTSAVASAKKPTDDTADAIGGAKQKLDDFQQALNIFTGKTDIQAALSGLKQKYDDVKQAVDAAGGKLDFSAKMTDKQRDAIVLARQKFADYITDVKTIADKQADLAKATGDSALATDKQKLAILLAAPKMFELAGKSKEARDAIFKLGESAGISKDQLMHAKDEVIKLRTEIGRLQNKTITITMVTKGDNSTSTGAGKALHESGAIERYAAGGVRSTPPNVAARPTILYGEGRAPEAFIPYEARYRERATELLSQVASDFGMQLVPAQGVLTGVSAASSAISASLGQATSALTATLGGSGTVTSTIVDLGDSTKTLTTTVGESSAALTVVVKDTTTKLSSTVSSTAASMAKTIAQLRQQIANLEAALAKAKTSTSTSSSGSSSSSTASKSTIVAAGNAVAAAAKAAAKKSVATAGYVEPYAGKSSSSTMIAGSTGGSNVSTHSGGGVTVNFNDTVIQETADVDMLTERMTMRLNAYG